MRVLVTTASKHGSTREIGSVVADRVRAGGLDVVERAVEELGDADLLLAQAIVLGSATYGARLLPAGTALAAQLADEFAGPVWLFGVGLKGITRDPLQLACTRPARAGYRAGRFPVFGGVVRTASLSRAERALIGALGAQERDERDLELVQAWADLITEELASATTAQGSSSTLPVV